MEVIESYAELIARPAFEPVVTFGPQHAGFGSIIQPVVLMEDAHCGISTCRTRYRRGYLISTSTGAETAIGGDCGRRHFGADFKVEQRRVDDALQTKRRMDAVKGMIARVPAMLEEMDQMEKDYHLLQSYKEWLMGAIGTPLFGALKRRADLGMSDITRTVRMTADEARAFRETNNRKRSSTDEWPTKEELICTLQGLAFFRARFKDMVVLDLLKPLRELAKAKAEDVASMKRRQLQMTAKWVGEVPTKLGQAHQVIADGKAFFTSENIAKLVHLGADRNALQNMISQLE